MRYALLLCLTLAGCVTDDLKPEVINSYCEQYRRVINAPGDGAEIAKLKRSLKEVIAANELTYKQVCRDNQPQRN
jgi:hypothetical protein